MESVFLKIPPRVSRPDIWELCQPKQIKAWIIDLPTANYGKVAQLLSERLRQLNRIEGDPHERFEILEAMRPAVYDLLEYLRGKAVGTRFPLNDENKKLSAFIFSITTEFASSYWSVAESLTRQKASRRLEKKSALIAQRTLVTIGQILFFHYLFKQAEPKGIWLDIHNIFNTFQKVSKNKITDSVGRKLPKTSLIDCYKQLLMLRLAEPYSLLHTEIVELFISLEKWADMVEFELLDKVPVSNLPFCYVDFQKDSSAIWLRNEKDQPSSSSLGFLDLSALFRLISDHKEFIDTTVGRYDALLLKGAQIPLSLGLIEHLEKRWGGIEQPAAKLFGDGHSRLFLLGLKAIHQNLAIKHGLDEVIQSEWLAETDHESGLLCDFPEVERISLGQLVAFRRLSDAKDKLALAVTSKVLNRQDGSVEFQLQMLAGKPQPAGIQSVSGGHQAQTYQRVILFFTQETTGRKVWIITESMRVKPGDQIRLITNREAVIAAISRKKNIGNGCNLLECKILKKAS